MKYAVIYGASFCSNCKPLYNKMLQQGISVEYKDVDDYEDEVVSLGIRSLPQVYVYDGEDGQIIFSGSGPVNANKVFELFGE